MEQTVIWELFSPPVKGVSIPKKAGGERILGIPTVSDRIAQMVCKIVFEPNVEKIFHRDSYGYRPGRSALHAIGITRRRCWRFDWVVEYDIKALFDTIDHSLLMKAVCKQTNETWILLYIERWLKAPMALSDGSLIPRDRGTPQGGVVSPVLSNLFLHYALDMWLDRTFPHLEWCRYADDGVIHCKSELEAEQIRTALRDRLEECGLELNEKKTKIVYCKDGRRKETYSQTQFTFLGYTFRRRCVRDAKGDVFLGFTPAVSLEARKDMQTKTRQGKIHLMSGHSLESIAKLYNPVLRGWMNYYGCFTGSAMYPVLRHFNKVLLKWAQRKYKKLKDRKMRSVRFMERVAKQRPDLFVHWSIKSMREGFI